MTRVRTFPGDTSAPRIDGDAVAAFFDDRARRIEELGPTRAVIYQDKHGDLAERRDRTETELLLPLLALDGQQAVLDIGCGTGRWSKRIVPRAARYHGIDFSMGLLEHAIKQHDGDAHCRFTRLSAADLSPTALGDADFDRILCSGVLIYLNDEQVKGTFSGIASIAALRSRFVLREPVGVVQRLTLHGHYSDDLEHEYHAIYRTEEELLHAMDATLFAAGFSVTDSGDVYADPSLNNRTETRQRWYVLERG